MSIILMLDSSISLSSSMMQTCDNCETIRQQNRKLNKQLAAFLEYQKELLVLKKIKKELEDIEAMGAEYNITMADFAQAIVFALDNQFAIESKPFIEKAKNAIKHIQTLAEKQPEKKEEQLKKEPKEVQQEKAKVEQKPKPIVHYERAELTTQRFQRKKQIPIEESKSQPTQKQPRFGIFQELNSFRRKEERQAIPYLSVQDTPSGLSNFDQSRQNQHSISNRSNAGDLCLPLNWQKRTFFDMANRTITKKFNDVYKKICTQTPLPRRGEHKMKFEVIKKGTWAVGIVPAAFKDGHMIDDRQCDAVKYLSFDNGSGLINLNGEKIANGDRVHLKPGQVLQIQFNADTPSITFKNPNMGRPLRIELTEGFKERDIYFFLEMKHFNTAVRMLTQ